MIKRRPTTISQIAQRAGVSTATVSHVINNTRFVSEAVRQRVQQAVDEVGYTPNTLARGLRAARSSTIGLIAPNIANPFFAEMARGVQKAVAGLGYSVIIASSDRCLEHEISTTRMLLARQVDGIIYASSWDGTEIEHIQTALAQDTAVVFFDRHTFDLPVDTIGCDNSAGGHMAGQHLVDLGHRRLACIAGFPEKTPNASRAQGFLRVLNAVGIPTAEIPLLRADFDLEGGFQASLKLLKHPIRPTGLFACNDLMAIGAMRAALSLGLRVPEDLSIVGFDNLEMAQYTNPPLTTIDHSAELLGRRAAEMILARITNPDLPQQHQTIDLKLLIRQSTSPLEKTR